MAIDEDIGIWTAYNTVKAERDKLKAELDALKAAADRLRAEVQQRGTAPVGCVPMEQYDAVVKQLQATREDRDFACKQWDDRAERVKSLRAVEQQQADQIRMLNGDLKRVVKERDAARAHADTLESCHLRPLSARFEECHAILDRAGVPPGCVLDRIEAVVGERDAAREELTRAYAKVKELCEAANANPPAPWVFSEMDPDGIQKHFRPYWVLNGTPEPARFMDGVMLNRGRTHYKLTGRTAKPVTIPADCDVVIEFIKYHDTPRTA